MINELAIHDPDWLCFISNHPDATIFHHPAWADLLSDCYGYTPFAAAMQDESGEIVNGLPLMEVNSWLTGRRIVSMPFSDFCQPLVSDGKKVDEFAEAFFNWWMKRGQVETQVNWPLPDHQAVFPGEPYIHHQTDLLPSSEMVFRSFKPKISRFIRQAEHAGVTIRQSSAWEDVALYYSFHLKARKRFGVPAQSLRYFRLLWEKIISPGMGYVLLAYQGERPLGGAIFLHCNKTLTYKYGASDPAYWRLRPNHLLFGYAIRWGCENGYQIFDWGRTDLEDGGLRDFKCGWGSEEQTMHYSILNNHPPGTGRFFNQSFRILKTVLQHSPAWVAKVTGELLYGHFT